MTASQTSFTVENEESSEGYVHLTVTEREMMGKKIYKSFPFIVFLTSFPVVFPLPALLRESFHFSLRCFSPCYFASYIFIKSIAMKFT